jgi:hypothetical protein
MDIKELKKEKTNQDDNEIILNKYRHHPLIKDLNLTDKELKEYLGVIAHIIKKKESYETSNHNNAFFYTQLIRNIHGKLEVISVPNEKTYE